MQEAAAVVAQQQEGQPEEQTRSSLFPSNFSMTSAQQQQRSTSVISHTSSEAGSACSDELDDDAINERLFGPTAVTISVPAGVQAAEQVKNEEQPATISFYNMIEQENDNNIDFYFGSSILEPTPIKSGAVIVSSKSRINRCSSLLDFNCSKSQLMIDPDMANSVIDILS